MNAKQLWGLCTLTLFAMSSGWACIPTKGKVKTTKIAKAKKPNPLDSSNCIKGRVIDEDNKGVSYVFVQTIPKTSPGVTDTNGHFSFCHALKTTDGAKASVKVPLVKQEYTVIVKKDGYIAKPIKLEYKGKGVLLSAIKLREKNISPGSEIKTSGAKNANKRSPSGGTGKRAYDG